jgi:sporulation protein YlmC with PRC-barrel domain
VNVHLARLQGARVWNEDGSRFGRVFELRVRADAGRQQGAADAPIESLLCGRPGLLERLGWRQRTLHAIPWASVDRIGPRGISIRGSVHEYPVVGKRR